MKVLAVVQARTGSTRLPGKVLLPIAGAPLLVRMLERVRAARTLTEVVVATTTDAADQPVRDLARQAGVRCVSGHPTDLLDRHYQAARECGLSQARASGGSGGSGGPGGGGDVVVKIPSDCPLIDPAVIDRVIGCYLEQPERYDFVSNLHPATYPDGNDVEVMPLAVLAAAWREAARPHEREHTTPFIWDQPERFRIGNVRWETGRDLSMTHRFTIDYPEDYAFVSAVFDALWTGAAGPAGPSGSPHGHGGPAGTRGLPSHAGASSRRGSEVAEGPGKKTFGLNEILDLLDARPDIFELNRRYAGVNWYRDHLGELATVGSDQTRRPEEARAT